MKYTQIPADTFQSLQMNAGILATGFDPATGVVTGLLGATSGGISFADAISFIDLGEDIDNCPKNMKELKQIDQRDVTMSGSFVTLKAATAKMLAIADIDSQDATKVVPRNDILDGDFQDIWFIGDYSNVNTGDNAGFLAIKLINALNTGGFALQTTDKAKGQFAFTFTGHYSMSDQTKVPYEIYCKGSGELAPSIVLSPDIMTLENSATGQITAVTVPAGAEVTYTSSATAKATVDSTGKVTAAASGTGSSIITGTITVDGVTYSDTMTVKVVVAET